MTDAAETIDERLGRIVALMAASEVYRTHTVADLDRVVRPCLALGQAWVTPAAFGTWAWLNAEAEAGFAARTRRLRPGDLRSGDRLWILNFAAPFGGARAHVRAFRDHLVSRYGTGAARWTRIDGDRAVRRIGRFSNETSQGPA